MRMPFKKQRRLKASARAATFGSDETGDEPSINLSRAFFVVLLLHLVAVGGIILFNGLKTSRDPARRQAGPPPRTAEGVSRAAEARGPSAAGRTTRIHYLRKGETLAQVAAFYGVAVSEIEEANQLKPGTTVPAGTELRLPTKSATGAVPLDVRKLVETPRNMPPAISRTASTRAVDSAPVKSAGVKALEEVGSRSAKARAAATPKPGPSPVVVARAAVPDSGDAAPVQASLPSGDIYTVGKGDTPASIAKRFGVGDAELLKVNGLDDPRKLQVGQHLLIPKRNP